MAPSPICLLSKVSKTKSWLWHRRPSHLNFGAINYLARHGLVRGLPKLKFEKHHLCSACAMGKSKMKPYKPESEDTNQEKLYSCTWIFMGQCVSQVMDNGTEFVNQTLREYYEKVGISHETSVACSPQQNGVFERRNRTLIEVARTMLIYAKAPLFLWAVHVIPKIVLSYVFVTNLGKLQPKADISIFIGYAPTKKAFRIYNRRTKRIIKTIHVDFDELTAMASEHSSSGPVLYEMTPATISSGLVPNPPPSTPVDCPAPEVFAPIPEVVASEPAASTGSPSSTTVDQDAPSPSNSQTTPETQSPVIPNDVEEDNNDLDVAHMNNDPFFGIPILENDLEVSSSSDVIPTVVYTATPNSEHVNKWTKDHPLDNIIGELKRPVSTRLQLHEQALFCYYDAFLTSVEPKNYKDALTQACWIEAMQEELHEFDHLEV
ncbi:retrovirus-related pol polyprotein from transposon TNT 1-94 [Tanacetum coccineum]